MPESSAGAIRESADGTSRSRTRRLGGRSARVRAAVFDATLAALLEGDSTFTIPQLAARAGVHDATIYRHWGSREALIADAIASRIGQEVPVPDTGSLRGDLAQFLQHSAAFLASPLGEQLVRASVARRDPEPTDVQHAYWPRRLAHIEAIFARAVARGEITTAADAAVAAELLLAPLYFRLLVTGAPLDDALVERIVGFLAAALSAQ